MDVKIFNNKIRIGYFFLSLLLLIPVYSLPKEFLNLELNAIHSPILDLFFKYVTYFGDGLWYVPLCLWGLYRGKKIGQGFILLLIIQTLFSNFFKKILFPDAPRPAVYLKEIIHSLHKVDGVTIHNYGSFASGHTMTAFAIAFYIIFNFKTSLALKTILIVLSILVAISRVYLLQHFYIDVVFGFYFGFISACLATLLNNKINSYVT